MQIIIVFEEDHARQYHVITSCHECDIQIMLIISRQAARAAHVEFFFLMWICHFSTSMKPCDSKW